MKSILMIVIALLASTEARSEFCRKDVDPTIERKAGYRWQYRTVDDRKCWYYSNRVIPKTDLMWPYTEEEFNHDIERVIERKFYPRVGGVSD